MLVVVVDQCDDYNVYELESSNKWEKEAPDLFSVHLRSKRGGLVVKQFC